MKRRTFFGIAGASALFHPGVSAQTSPKSGSRTRIDLNGLWDRFIEGTRLDSVSVPASLRPSGRYDLRRNFVLPRLAAQERAILHFDAITYFARAYCNGSELGAMGPYVPYEWDLTSLVHEGINELRVAITDLTPEPGGAGRDELDIGINPGWEAYGGIIRDVWVEIRRAVYIDNVQVAYSLGSDSGLMESRIRVYLNQPSTGSGDARVILQRGDQTIASATRPLKAAVKEGFVELPLTVHNPALWSPDSPQLYDVIASIDTPAGSDSVSFRTGFRTFRVNGSTFQLNGERIILNGVCRHDMWQHQGFTLSRKQMEYDMRAIKAMGANFVRLVHYPHHRYILELADELGLLVSEEPGYWQVDFRKLPRSAIELGLRTMERTIRRDWNSPSIVMWLLANECRLTADYLKEGKALCRKIDPLARLVSAANNMRKEEAKPLFEEADMDFFDDHPYTFQVDQIERIAEYYGTSRPLALTEWGGKEIGQSKQTMPHTVDTFLDLQKSNRLAGTAFWSWQDVPEFSRIDPEMRNGILESGVVTEAREPREFITMELVRLWEGRYHVSSRPAIEPEVVPLRHAPWSAGKQLHSLDLGNLAAENAPAWRDFERLLAEFWPKQGYAKNQWAKSGEKFRLWETGNVQVLGVPFTIPVADGYIRPLVLTSAYTKLTIPVNRTCTRLHVLGHVSCPDGFPTNSEAGTVAGSCRIQYQSGREDTIPLRHGFEIARANMIYASSRIDPVATDAQRAVIFIKDTAREHYQVLVYTISAREPEVQSLQYRLSPGEQPLLIFAVVVETP